MLSSGLRILQRCYPLHSASKLSSSLLSRLSKCPVQLSLNSPLERSRVTKRFFGSTATQSEPAQNAAETQFEEDVEEQKGTIKVISYTPTEIYENNSLLQEITGGDQDKEKTLRILCLEYDILRQEGCDVPTSISVENWQTLLDMQSIHGRKKFLRFLFIKEIRKSLEKDKKQQRREKRLALQEENVVEEDDGHIKYGLGNNALFHRIYESTITEYDNYRLIRAMELQEQKIFIDCGFDSSMSPAEKGNLANQLQFAFACNRVHSEPFDLHLCNVQKDSSAIRKMMRAIPMLLDTSFPCNVTEKSYLDIVPKESIVYLTPHCREVMRDFDHDANYIIGGIVDKSNQEPLTLAKAKREGLRMAKFPLDEYMHWGAGGSKFLTLDQVLKIMLDMRKTGDWNYALRHVPRRKLKTNEEVLNSMSAFKRRKNPFENWEGRAPRNRFVLHEE
ncbi:mitochondrial ribonuclease P protein 1 homolog [Neocloeon triangulifer]|uniref:mitochondrial ribonuclease P protein 1 homolog n=1 Tax=Neocloeon triangulifer TaxID=2078957 RepID=UPI00286EC444|nr:mitochondrial ribonuclease P protein 1 homolog [Neocloeon triangulifer]